MYLVDFDKKLCEVKIKGVVTEKVSIPEIESGPSGWKPNIVANGTYEMHRWCEQTLNSKDFIIAILQKQKEKYFLIFVRIVGPE